MVSWKSLVTSKSLVGITLLQKQQALTGVPGIEENQHQDEGQPANLLSVSEMFLEWLRLPGISNLRHKELLRRNSQKSPPGAKQNTVMKRLDSGNKRTRIPVPSLSRQGVWGNILTVYEPQFPCKKSNVYAKKNYFAEM